MCDLPKFESDLLLVGFDTSDDAAVYKINENQAVIQTLDFFTPIVDNPYDFGAIAAANALSDVYAMGGIPTLALNIVGFPNCLSPDILKEIMRGGADKVKEAGALLVGGHSIEDDEPKYGLSVMGLIHPDKIWRNIGAREGDVLILTKPIGTGILTTALKAEMLSESVVKEVTHIMSTLNKVPAEILKKEAVEIHACTDVTGFGLVGHALEMAEGSNVSIELDYSKICFIDEAMSLAEMGILPAGMYKNRKHCEGKVLFDDSIDEKIMDLLYDPQTSGGLLFALPKENAEVALELISTRYSLKCSIVGKVLPKDDYHIYIK